MASSPNVYQELPTPRKAPPRKKGKAPSPASKAIENGHAEEPKVDDDIPAIERILPVSLAKEREVLKPNVFALGSSSLGACDATPPNPALDHHVREIESSDGSLSTTIRAVYDNKSKDSFVYRLDNRIKQHDRDIETMCNHYCQGFIDSIRELLGVRLETQKLKEQIVETNDDIQVDSTIERTRIVE